MKATNYVIDVLGDFAEYSTISGDITLIPNNKYIVDTSASPSILTLPTANSKDEIVIFDQKGTFDTNNCTITSSENINGSSNDLTLDLKGLKLTMMYSDSSEGWKVKSLDSKYIKNAEIDKSNLNDGYVLQYNAINQKIEFQSFVERTQSPVLSGPSTGTEQSEIQINIDNHDSNFTYDVNITSGSFTRSANIIYWTLPDVVDDETHTLSVTAEDTISGYEVSLPTNKQVTVERFDAITDETQVVENTGFNGFIEDGEDYSIGSVEALSDTAWVLTIPEYQDTGENDFEKFTPKMRVLTDSFNIDGSSTVDSLILDGNDTGIDDFYLKYSGDNLVEMIGNVSGISVQSGEIDSMGSEQVFNSGNTYEISAVMIDDTHICVSYQDNSNSDYGTSIIGTISGNSISWGSEQVFNSGDTNYTSAVRIDDTHICVSYSDQGNSDYGTSII